MDLSEGYEGREQQIIDMFVSTFTSSDGAEEGQSIDRLVNGFIDTTPDDDMVIFCADEGSALVGCIVFSRLDYVQDDRTVFVLAPVAVRTDRQSEGIGQKLLTFGLGEMRNRGVDAVLTYGDPRYYSKVGFKQITEDFAQAPHPLSHPYAWLGQSLADQDPEPLVGPCRCVPALDSPEYW